MPILMLCNCGALVVALGADVVYGRLSRIYDQMILNGLIEA